MARRRCLGPGCGVLLPAVGAPGGRPRRFCSERCRSRHRRFEQRIDRNRDRREDRLTDTAEQRHRLQATAYLVAQKARRLAADLDTEAARPDWQQPAWQGQATGRPPVPYSQVALELREAAEAAVAAAVAADRAAGYGWAEIGAALGISEDTAARRYRTL